jgi:hypothetical protein
MFITWPFLWPNPIDHWMDSLVLMVKFPWPARVLFNGQYYDPDNLPLSYLPTLLGVQLTEPLVISICLGLIALIFFFLRQRLKLDLFLFLSIGALLPLTGLIITRATMYDNFRQVLFLIPPLIVVSGFAFDSIFSVLRSTAIRLALFILMVFPGIYSIVQLHPYQYIYYNSFVGGTGGALRSFEMDYWFTSYRETALWLNENVHTNANVGGNGPTELLYVYLRPDLNPQLKSTAGGQYDFFVAVNRYNQDLTLYPDAKVIHSIVRDGAILAAIKQTSP